MKKILLLLLILIWTLLITSVLNSQWIKVESGTYEKLTDVVMLDSLTAVVVGKGRSILRTSDGGTTWENLTIMLSSVAPWNGVSFYDSKYGIAVGESQIRLTADGGKSWTYGHIPDTLRREYLSALYLSPANIYIGADSGWIYNSLDTGKTWTAEKISDEPVRSMFAWTGEYVMGLPIYALTSNSLYENQTFPSGEWGLIQIIAQGLGSEVYDGEFVKDGGPGFIVGVQGDLWEEPVVYRKTFSDTTWRNVLHTIFTSGTLHGVSAPSSDVIYTCGNNGLIVYTNDGGNSWSLSEAPTRVNLSSIYFFDDSHGFAVGDSGVILAYKGNIIDAVKDDLNPTGFELYQNYPNPFNPSTKIKYSIPLNVKREMSNVKLTIYDILGNKVETVVNEEKPAGEYEVEFDGSRLASGVYFYNLITGNKHLTGKMNLIK